MNYPSVKRLEANFPNKGEVLRKLLWSDKAVRDHYAAKTLAQQCHNRPSIHHMRMEALNAELEGHGVEAMFAEGSVLPDMEYINMGDTYNTTIIYDYFTTTFKIQDVGTWLEVQERRGRRF